MPTVRVLSVNDDEARRYAIDHTLRDAGFETLHATSGAEALELTTTRRPDVVLVDVKLPDMDGFEVCRRIKAHPATAAVPVVILSAIFLKDDGRAHGVEAGADVYLTDPLDPAVLVATVRSGLGVAGARQEAIALRAALDRERAMREQAETASRAKDQFLALASHELRTPLNVMLSTIHLLRTGRLPEDQVARTLDTLERNARVQAQLINDLVDVSRIVTGKLVLDATFVDVQAAARDAVEAVRGGAEAKRVRLHTDLGTSRLPVVGEAARVQQIVATLLKAAIRATPPRGIVSIAIGQDESRVRIVVGDAAMEGGLPDIFDPFAQADGTTVRRASGLGVDLAIVRHLVDLHGGTVRAERMGTGQSTAFVVTLPLAANAGAMTPVTEGRPPVRATGERADRALSGLQVLVVDDDPDTLETLSAVLVEQGAAVRTASSVAKALLTLTRLIPDVLVADIAMPDADGYALIRAVRMRTPERGGRVPAVALTAYSQAEHRDRALTSGYQMHLAKPVDPARLVDAVATLSRRKLEG